MSTPVLDLSRSALVSSAFVLLIAPPTLAQHVGDVIIRPSGTSARIQTGAFPVGGSLPDFPVLVHAGVFGEQPNFTNDPGFDSGPGVFPPSSQIGFDILDALRNWNGANFGTIPAERIDIRFGVLGPISTPPAAAVVPGLSASVSASGEYHKHFGFTLTAPASDGAYLLNLRLWSNSAAIGPSDPFWIVFRQGGDVGAFNVALAWATANLPISANPCPPDLTTVAVPGQPGYGTPNGVLNNDDFFYYLSQFAAGNLAVADTTTTAIPGSVGYGVPNGVLNNDDFFYYLALFAAGC